MKYYIIIRGPLGIGKTTIAKELSKKIKAEYIAYDRIIDEYELHKDQEEGYISQKSFFKVNEIVIKQVNSAINKKPVILDGNFYWKSQIDDLIDKLKHPHYVFTLKAPLETCIERDDKREKTHGKDAAEAVYKKSTSFDYGIQINTNNKTKEQVIDEILNKVYERRG